MPELISHTTRNKREGEIDGKTYHFVSDEEFNQLDLVEDVEFDGNKYGLSKKEIHNKLKNNDKVVVIVDIDGYEQIKSIFDEYLTIMVYIDVYPSECLYRMVKERGFLSAIKRFWYDLNEKVYSNRILADIIIRNKNLERAKRKIKKLL